MRIGIGGIGIECCTFSPLPTPLDSFRVVRGEELLSSYPMLEQFEAAAFVPTLRARSIPGGPVERKAYEALKREFLERLGEAGALDGLFLHLHGAMYVEGMEDAEGDWIAAARSIVGNDCLVSAAFDLHGNVSPHVVDGLDMLSTYRTAPHIDAAETQERALRMLVSSIEQGIRPEMAWVPVPVLLPGEKTSTEWEPGKSLYAELPEVDSLPGVMDASIFVGYAWADEPRANASVVVTGTDCEVIWGEARRLAERYWDLREEFRFGSPAGSIDECIGWALEASESCVFISDSGDNPTAGGCGDVPVFLERLIAHRVEDAVVASIADEAAVAACFEAGEGAKVDLELGGKLDPVHATPLSVTGRVVKLDDTAGEAVDRSESGSGGAGDKRTRVDLRGPRVAYRDPQRQAVLSVDGILVIVTERRTPFHFISDFQRLGIEPADHAIVVVKIGYLVPDLRAAAPRSFLALSPGAVDQAIPRLPFRRVSRPIYPLDPEMTWDSATSGD